MFTQSRRGEEEEEAEWREEEGERKCRGLDLAGGRPLPSFSGSVPLSWELRRTPPLPNRPGGSVRRRNTVPVMAGGEERGRGSGDWRPQPTRHTAVINSERAELS